MSQVATRGAARQKRHDRIRLTLAGTAARPRLAVFRSLNHIYAQVIDDASGRTLAAAAKKAGVEACVFDRAGYLYHGRVKALAEGAREGGLKF